MKKENLLAFSVEAIFWGLFLSNRSSFAFLFTVMSLFGTIQFSMKSLDKIWKKKDEHISSLSKDSKTFYLISNDWMALFA